MFSYYRRICLILSKQEVRKLWLLSVLAVFAGFAEMLGVASVLPFLSVAADPSLMHQSGPIGALYDFVGQPSQDSFLLYLGVGSFIIVVTGSVIKLAYSYISIRFAQMRSKSIGAKVLKAYLSRDYERYSEQSASGGAQHITSEADQVVARSIVPFVDLLAQCTTAIFICLLVIYMNPLAAFIGGGAIAAFYFGFSYYTRRLSARLSRSWISANTERFSTVQEAMAGFKEIKLRALEDYYLARFNKSAFIIASTNSKSNVISSLPRSLLEALMYGGMIIFTLVLLADNDNNLAALIPTIGLYALAGAKLFPCAQTIYRLVVNIRFGKASQDKLIAIISEIGNNAQQEAGHSTDQLKQAPALSGAPASAYEMRDVSYRYPTSSQASIENVSFSLAPNSSLGVVGATGAGKSTLIDLFLGLLIPSDGEILVDHVPLTQENIRDWRRHVGYVPQDIFILNKNIAQNIAFGIDPAKIDMEAVRHAAKLAQLDAFIEADLPDGYQTMVGENGTRLSGGQRQRIGIARALYHNPEILVLDEATSALDSPTEQAVMSAVENITAARTVVMIAHRLTTVRNCDKIIVLEKGRIIAQGTYEELLVGNAYFRQLAQA